MTTTPSRLIEITSAEDPRIAEFRGVRDRDLTRSLDTGQGAAFIAEGTVVLTMLAKAHHEGRARARKLLLLKNRVAGLAELLARFPQDVPVYVADAAVIDAIAGFHLHRGVLALGTRDDPPPLLALLSQLGPGGLALVGCGISNHDNVGTLFRNAAAFSADMVLLDETCCDPLYRKALRVSVGAVLGMPYHRGGTIEDILEALRDSDFSIYGLSPRGALEIGEIPVTPRMALVVGTEGEGLPQALLSRFSSARIAQSPELDSLNVGTAAGIALYRMALAQGRIA